MQTTLLSTKLHLPPRREALVSRPRLAAMLSNASSQGFTLVSAPAGYGKTTLVSSWLRETGFPCAWLSLEDSDNDPVRFLQYLLAALQPLVPAIRLDLLDLLDGQKPAAMQAVLSILINAVAGQAQPFVLVLDDFHLVRDDSVLDIVGFLLEHHPPQKMHLVLITRSDPPLPLARLRARGQMAEIRAEQLRFTPGEVAEFVNDVMGLHLPQGELAAIHERTEGWIAGLQLAGLSMQGRQDLPGFIAAFSGSHHYIVDYLTDEVLRRQDEPTRAFLLRTSILSRLCGSLCDSLVEREGAMQLPDGQRMLEALERHNLFIIPLDEERRWFRYHHLFADALNRRLEYLYPAELPELYRRASTWYEQRGLVGEAIQYALNARDSERAARLVEQNGCYLLMSGEVVTLLKWMEAVEPYFEAHPWLVIQKGWALTLAGRMEPAGQAFQLAERLVSALPRTPDAGTMLGTIWAGRAYWAEGQGDLIETARLAQQALDLLQENDGMSQSMRSVATGALAKTYFVGGELERARQVYEQALDMGQAANNLGMIINSKNDLADILIEQGNLRQAERLLSEILPMTLRPDGQRLPLSARLYNRLARVFYEWNQLEQAASYAQRCLEVSRQFGEDELHIGATILSARLELARGRQEAAQALVSTAEQINRNLRSYPWDAIRLETAIDHAWLSMGYPQRMSARYQAREIQPGDEITFLNEPRYVTLLRWLLARAEYQSALDLARRMLAKARAENRRLRVVELLVLQALAYQGLKDFHSATEVVSQALALAEPEGYRRVFLDEGESLRRLLHLARSYPAAAVYAGRLLDELGAPATAVHLPSQPLVEPLSGRELEVLRLVQDGLSNQEIAAKLFISITTVKRHISNIYAKLEVKNRTQAVARGKQLGFFSG